MAEEKDITPEQYEELAAKKRKINALEAEEETLLSTVKVEKNKWLKKHI